MRSDGCASQFRSRFVFHLTLFFPESYQVIRYCNERHQGKGPMDGIGGCVKSMVFRAVLSEKVVIYSPGNFARYADNNLKGVSVLFMPTSEITEEPEFFRETPYVESMCALKVHMLKSFKTKGGFYCLQFFKIATADNAFYNHWYRRPDDLTIHVIIWFTSILCSQ